MINKKTYNTAPGKPLPLGANFYGTGVQFSIFSRNAKSVYLILFHDTSEDSLYDEFLLDYHKNKTGDIWHIWIENIKHGQTYGYKFDGQYEPEIGHRFNINKFLVDPYAKAVSGNFKWDTSKAIGYDPETENSNLSFSSIDSARTSPRSIVIDTDLDLIHKPLNRDSVDAIIYELHVRGFTYNENSGVSKRGTFKGLTEKIPYLKDLGITAVELMPIQEFDELENVNINPVTGERLKNYWGYSTMAFFAPNNNYCSSRTTGEQVKEFREMVTAFHEAGIEVIMDVVFNHTSEGDHTGPTVSFRGIDNKIYYILEDDKRFYKNYSGCGNTFNCNQPLVREFILDCLRYWVIEMKIDGFRFDLASILGRDESGNLNKNPSLIEIIEDDPILRNTKIIAEAWDAAGAYQVGSFPGRWSEWNGKYRDDVRRFWKRETNTTGFFATRITGSSDLYGYAELGPIHSINFITCHDGFTLNDLVSYNNKHNLENGENNRDGENNNTSFNNGIEGNIATPYIEKKRSRQIKNFIGTLFLSQGIPMLLAGDEFRRTQNGNNNSYCQDNEISWIDWSMLEKNNDIFRFVKYMIEFRKKHPSLRRENFFSGTAYNGNSQPDISWHGEEPFKPDWSVDSHSIAMLINGNYTLKDDGSPDNDIFIIFNASLESSNYNLPESPSGRKWIIAVDTFNESGITPEVDLKENKYYVNKNSLVILFA